MDTASVTGNGMQGRRTEIRNELNLPLGIARSRRHRQHAETFGTVLEAQSARKHAVPRRVLKDIAPPQADHIQATRHGIGPLVQILLRVQDDRRGARRATGRMQAHHFAHWNSGKPERVIIAQILFRSKRNLTQVIQRTYVFRRQMSLGKPFLVKRRFHTTTDRTEQTFELQRLNFCPRQSF